MLIKQFFKDKWNIAILFTVLGVFFLGVYIGKANGKAIDEVLLANKETPTTNSADFEPFWKTWNLINEKYVSPEKATDQDRVYGAIQGLMESLNDPYSVFFPPAEAKSFEEQIAGNFGGVGMEVDIKDKVLTVVAPLKDTPAYKAGIKSGDKILKIDKTIATGLSTDEAVKLMRGEKGTTVVLTILHEGDKEPVEIKIVRDIINFPTIDTELRKDGIFVIKLYSFSATSPGLFRNAIKEFANSGTDKLLLDLRGNPGGYLDAAVDMASWFLPSGKVIVTEDYGKNGSPDSYRSKGYDLFNDNLKFVILIDGGSASASEILAGAMQDYKRATLVGSQSFGKGSVQETMKVTPDTLLKITIAKWLTPNGTSISAKGLTPDVVVKFTKDDIIAKNDVQLNKAVELLLKK